MSVLVMTLLIMMMIQTKMMAWRPAEFVVSSFRPGSPSASISLAFVFLPISVSLPDHGLEGQQLCIVRTFIELLLPSNSLGLLALELLELSLPIDGHGSCNKCGGVASGFGAPCMPDDPAVLSLHAHCSKLNLVTVAHTKPWRE